MQRHFDLIRWTMPRVAHIARHDVTPEEADEVLCDERCVLRRGRDRRYLLYGRTDAGRRLLLVLEDEGGRVAGLVTARDVSDTERRTYFGKDENSAGETRQAAAGGGDTAAGDRGGGGRVV